MTGPADPGTLARECAVFTRYLTGIAPSQYVMARYAAAHPSLPTPPSQAPPIDRLLVGAAARGVLLCRAADAYARWFRPRGLLRQKLVLTLAVLENSPPTHRALTAATAGSRLRVVLGIVGAVGLGLSAFLAGLVAFGPLHLVLAARRPSASPPAHG